MDTAPESNSVSEIPKKGDTFQVLDTPEIREAGGLAVHDYTQEGIQFKVGPKHMEEKLVRLPVGTTIQATQLFKNEEGIWATFEYPYQGPNQAPKVLKLCILIEEVRGLSRVKHMEKVQQSAGAALDELRKEIEASRGQA